MVGSGGLGHKGQGSFSRETDFSESSSLAVFQGVLGTSRGPRMQIWTAQIKVCNGSPDLGLAISVKALVSPYPKRCVSVAEHAGKGRPRETSSS